MKARLLLGFACLVLCSCAFGQVVSPEQQRRATEIADKLHRVELLNQILPIAMTKDQIHDLLPAIEKARQKIRDEQDKEYKEMLDLEKRADKAISDAKAKGMMPPKDLLTDLQKFTREATNRQLTTTVLNVDALMEAFKKVLNAGQLKAAANSLTVQYYEPSVTDPTKVSEDFKLSVFVKWVLLDPVTYDMLVDMSKKS